MDSSSHQSQQWIATNARHVSNLADIAGAAGVPVLSATVRGYHYGEYDRQSVCTFQTYNADGAADLLEVWGVEPLTDDEQREQYATRLVQGEVVEIVWAVNA